MNVYSLCDLLIKNNNKCFMHDDKLICNDLVFDCTYSYNKIGDKINKYYCDIKDIDGNTFDGISFTSCYWACIDAFNKRH